jgi:lysyl-tRNA synthetase class II
MANSLDTRPYCKDCRKRISIINWNYHIQGESHLKNVKPEGLENNEKDNCKVCGRIILKRNMSKHLSNHREIQTKFDSEISGYLNSKTLTKSFEKISNIIRDNPNMQIQEQFGSNEKLTTIVV